MLMTAAIQANEVSAQSLDGLDAWAAIADGAASPRDEVVHSLDVIRKGDWKFIEEGIDYYGWTTEAPELYDIAADPYEQTNLAASETAKVAELRARLADHAPSARDAEASEDIPDYPPVVYGEEENAAFAEAVEHAVDHLRTGNPAPSPVRLEVSGASVKLVHDEALDAASYETTLPIGGSETLCLREGSAACPPTPTFEDGASASRAVPENAPAGTAVGAAVAATDVGGNALAYSLAGPNAAEFAIGASSGQLTTAAVLDHEAGSSRSVTVSAADGNGGATSIPVTVSVTNVNEPPDVPTTPTVSGASSTSLSVSWSAPANAGRPALTDYDVQYRAGAEGASGWSATGEGRTEAADEETLTARFENVPVAHDGSSVFRLELVFSEAVFDGTESFDKNQVIQDALQVTDGTVAGRRRADPNVYDRWILRIRPSGDGDVTVGLPATTGGCSAADAICTPNGRALADA